LGRRNLTREFDPSQLGRRCSGERHRRVSSERGFGPLRHPSTGLDVEVVDAPVGWLSAFRAAPNSTRAASRFSFVLDVPAAIELRVYSINGRQVFRTQQQHDGLRRGFLQWDGRDGGGHAVASGVYVYRFTARPAGSPPQEVVGKLVMLR
jgi:hypothetical protein